MNTAFRLLYLNATACLKHITNKWLYGLFALTLSFAATAQLENSKWYFGYHGRLDFGTTPPGAPAYSGLFSAEGCASVCDAQGNLLFYTNGEKIWDTNYYFGMANGTSLGGNPSSSQGVLIVKKPGASSIYFVFTLDDYFGSAGWQYSVVDMSLAAGAGSVTAKNIPIYPIAAEKMTATQHCNGTDMWVIAHDSTDQFLAVQVSAAGVNTVPVISSAGLYYGNSGFIGTLRVRPDGKKIASAGCWFDSIYPFQSGAFEIFDFDNATGIVSNGAVLAKGYKELAWSYSCEFSPNGRYLYGTSPKNGPGVIWQWDLCAGNIDSVRSSQFTVANYSTTQTNPAAIARAIDNRIYVATGGPYLSVINSPDSAKNACNYVHQGLQLVHPGSSALGLPNMFFPKAKPDFSYTTTCLGASFSLTKMYPTGCMEEPGFNETVWNFGDPGSSGSNISTQNSPTHYFSSPGKHTIKLLIKRNCTTDTITKIVDIPACTGLQQSDKNKRVKVYPNPAEDFLMIETTESGLITIRNAQGMTITEKHFPAGSHTLELGAAGAGFYSLEFSNNETTDFIKIITLR